MWIIGLATIGEISSILIHLFIYFLGDYKQIFNKNYYRENDIFSLTMVSIFAGWFAFPFFWYVAYKQLTLK